MPDYEGTDDSHVVMHLPGRILDEKYSIMLLENSNITLTEAVLLDQVQKGILPKDDAVNMLRKKHILAELPNAPILKSKVTKVTWPTNLGWLSRVT